MLLSRPVCRLLSKSIRFLLWLAYSVVGRLSYGDWRGKERFVIGVGCDGRNFEELDLGLYTRYVPLLADFEEELTFEQVFTEVNKSLLTLDEEQLYSTGKR